MTHTITRHTKISYLKSVVRIAGYAAILVDLRIAVVVLIASEFVGILEEYVL
jgi:hypothetical protein